MKQLLWYLLAGTRGGETRARIIHTLLKKPANTHALAKSLQMDYKTIQHHLPILVDNDLLTVIKRGSYGAVYFISPELEKNISQFQEIWERFGNNSGKNT